MIIPDVLTGLTKGLTVKTLETAKRLYAAALWGNEMKDGIIDLDDGEAVELWQWLTKEDSLNWDYYFKTPPLKPATVIEVEIKYAGPSEPLPYTE